MKKVMRHVFEAEPGEWLIVEPGYDIEWIYGPLPPEFVNIGWCDLCREHHDDPCPWIEIEEKYEGVG